MGLSKASSKGLTLHDAHGTPQRVHNKNTAGTEEIALNTSDYTKLMMMWLGYIAM